jgi:uncharacterized protein (DUF4415 family)
MSKTDKDLILEVTQSEYDEAMKKGWTDDDIQKPGKHRFRPTTRVAESEDILPSNIKVQITLRVDLDVLEYFKKRASAPRAAPYQTQINNELRRIMEIDLQNATSLEKDILNNKEFLRALKEKLATV